MLHRNPCEPSFPLSFSGENEIALAAMSADIETAKLAYRSGVILSTNLYGQRPLHFIALSLKKEVNIIFAQWLLDIGDDLFHQDNEGRYPIFFAANRANWPMFEFLLTEMETKKQLDVEFYVALAREVCSASPFVESRYAEQNRYAMIIALKKRGINFDLSGFRDISLWQHAAHYHPYLARYFTSESGVNRQLCEYTDENELKKWIACNDEQKIKACVYRNTKWTFKFGISALLLLAGKSDNVQLAKWFIEYLEQRCNIFQDIPDLNGIRPIHAAAVTAHLNIFSYLLSVSIRRFENVNKIQDNLGRTPAHAVAMFVKSSRGIETLQKRSDIVKMLGENGADFNQVDVHGLSAIDYAKLNFPELVPLMNMYNPAFLSELPVAHGWDQDDLEESTGCLAMFRVAFNQPLLSNNTRNQNTEEIKTKKMILGGSVSLE